MKRVLILTSLIGIVLLGTIALATPPAVKPVVKTNIGNFLPSPVGTYAGIFTLEAINAAGLSATQIEGIIDLSNKTKRSLEAQIAKRDALIKSIQDALVAGKDVTYMKRQLRSFSLERQKLIEEFKDGILNLLRDEQKSAIRDYILRRLNTFFSSQRLRRAGVRGFSKGAAGEAIVAKRRKALMTLRGQPKVLPNVKDMLGKLLDKIRNMTPEEYAKNRERIVDTFVNIIKTAPKVKEEISKHQLDILMLPLLQDNTLNLLKRRAEFLKSNPTQF